MQTALYYAARLHFADRVAGFVAECLVEAQERCLSSRNGGRYRVADEVGVVSGGSFPLQ